MLIGITGQKRTGKDTIANYLIDKYRFNKHGFADKVKAMLYAINPYITDFYIYEGKLLRDEFSEGYGSSLQEIVNAIGWEQSKEIPEVRQLLQRLGTEGGRKLFGENFWVNQLFNDLGNKYLIYETGFPLHRALQSNIVIPDVRFDNEAQRILAYGGYVIRVERDGLPIGDTHASEQPIHPKLISARLQNDSTLETLYGKVEGLLNKFNFLRPQEWTGEIKKSTAQFDNLGTTVTGIDNIVPNESN